MTTTLAADKHRLEYHLRQGSEPAVLFLNGGHISALSPVCDQWFIEHDWTVITVLQCISCLIR